MKEQSLKKLSIRKTEDLEFENPIHMQTLEWDKEWKKDMAKERNRYRTRLTKKHGRNSASMTI